MVQDECPKRSSFKRSKLGATPNPARWFYEIGELGGDMMEPRVRGVTGGR